MIQEFHHQAVFIRALMGSVSLLNKLFGVIAMELVLNACADLDTVHTACSDPTCTNQSPVTSSRPWPFSNEMPAVTSKGKQDRRNMVGVGEHSWCKAQGRVEKQKGCH